MRKIIILGVCLIMSVGAVCAQGIKFEKVGWNKLLAKAKKENKLIFIDCHTSWCGPCKRLATNVFTRSEVGNFFNKHFINAKYDMEVGEGIELKKKFEITAYPTLLYVNSRGEIEHRSVGAVGPEALIQQGKLAMDPERNFASIQKRYEEGDRTPAFLESYINALDRAAMRSVKMKVVEEYLAALPLKDLLTKEKWSLVEENIKDPVSPVFQQVVLGRQTLKKQLGDVVDSRIFIVLRNQMAKMNEEVAVWDTAYYGQFVKFLQRVTYEKAPMFLAQLYALKHAEEGEYQKMLDVLQEVFQYNLMQGFDRTDCLVTYLNKMQKCQDMALVGEVCQWVDGLEQGTIDPLQKVALKDLQYNLLITHGRTTEAEQVKAVADEICKKFEQDYKHEITRRLVN